MKRHLILAIACGAWTQLALLCPADDRDGRWPYDDSRYGPGTWQPVPTRSADRGPSVSPFADSHAGNLPAVPPDLRNHWLGDLSFYANDDPVPAPMSLAPVSFEEDRRQFAPRPVPPVPAPPVPSPYHEPGAPGAPGPAPPQPFGPQGRLEPVPDEQFRLPGGPVGGPVGGPLPAFKPGDFAPPDAPLYPWVAMRDLENIAPGAVPVVVAVRHPEICPFPCRCHRDQVAFVEVWAPPCAPRSVKVKRHGTEVKLDYGSHDIEITSRGGQIRVKYDD